MFNFSASLDFKFTRDPHNRVTISQKIKMSEREKFGDKVKKNPLFRNLVLRLLRRT